MDWKEIVDRARLLAAESGLGKSRGTLNDGPI
jgi:hypothetical protein